MNSLCKYGSRLVLAATAGLSAPGADALLIPVEREVDFVKDVQPIFREHCISCHGEKKQKSEYRLDLRETAIKGGDSGEAAILPGKSAESPLFRFVAGIDEKMLMPPRKSDQARLTSEQVAVLRAWIDQGARWPENANAKAQDKRDWWSLKPVARPALPKSGGNPIDAFIDAKLAEKGLARSPEADRRTLIRRLYFDLTGLPPTPENVDTFLADSAPQAWERLVDKLLASPRYGERWARHWLDVVHYGETHGYDKDRPRRNAWPYRDYVIRAFNEDKPYARFVQEQLAGDVLFPGTRDGIEALGFIAAGPWDLISHMEVPETKIDGKIARHLDRDDMVQNTILTFNSLTIGCAQCHDHKFDPISQDDYYRLQAVFAAVDRTEVPYFPEDKMMARFTSLHRARSDALSAIAALEQPLKAKVGEPFQELSRRMEGAAKAAGAQRTESGYHSAVSSTPEEVKWVQVDLGRRCNIDHVTLLPCSDDFNGIGHGFGFPVRFKIEASGDPDFKSGVTVFWTRYDETFMSDFANPRLRPFSAKAGMGGIEGRYVRVTAAKLAPRKDDYIFALAELQAFDSAGTNVALHRPVTALDSIEAPPRWSKTNLTDGRAPDPAPPEERRKLALERDALLLSAADQTIRDQLAAARRQLSRADAGLRELPAPHLVYAGAIHTGNGSFRGTGPDGGKPRVIRILHRGDVKEPGPEVGPGALSAVAGLPARFELPPNHSESERRAALAQWLTSPQQPLTWRSIVNRVWQYHFGRGLVETANDFGHNGARPTHPELLDWLASEFRDSGGSFKQLHKLIVTSATYRQISTEESEGNKGTKESSLPSLPSVQIASAIDSNREVFTEGTEGNKGTKNPSLSSLPSVQTAPVVDSNRQAFTEGNEGNKGAKIPLLSSLPSVQSASAIDPENFCLWRMNRRKLDAEALRDSVLFVSGKLDLTMGGPSFQDFVLEQPDNSPHYEYQLHDPNDPSVQRRSIYRFIVRSQLQPFMTALDCADPSMQVDKRNESLSPIQALALLNNGLMVTMSKHFAAKLDTGGGGLASKVERAFREALGRKPTAGEQESFTVYAQQYGLANTCRVIFNLNEFAFAD